MNISHQDDWLDHDEGVWVIQTPNGFAYEPLESNMPDWHNHLTEQERARLAEIDASLDALTLERRAMMNRAKQRKHRRKV